MKGVPYYDAGKGDAPRSCNSKAYLENYEKIFKKARRKTPDEKRPTEQRHAEKRKSKTLYDLVRQNKL